MAGSADRAINMALRVVGIGEVERDFKRVGDAGSKSFAEVKKSANGAAQEVSEYTARLRRAVEIAKQSAAQIPDLSKNTPVSRANRNSFVTGAVNAEKERIVRGLPDLTRQLGQAETAALGFSGSMSGATATGLALGGVLAGLAVFVKDSIGAFAEHEQALAAFDATLALAGNRSNATGDEIKAMAEKVVAATGQTEKAALDAAATLAKIPGITREGLEAALDASARLADALGGDVSKTADATAAVLTALAEKDMKALVDATKGVNDELAIAVIKLAEAGKTAEAQKVYIEGLSKAAGTGPGGLTDTTHKLSDAWDNLKKSFGESFAAPAAATLDWLSGYLDTLRGKIQDTAASWKAMLSGEAPLSSSDPFLPAGQRRGATVKVDLEAARRDTAARDAAAADPGRPARLAAERKALDEKYGNSSTTRTNQQILADFERELAKRGVQYLSNPVRTAAQQNALFRQGLTPLDGYTHPSRHQSQQAIDFHRATFDEQKVREAAMAAGLKGLELVTESGGRKHAEWSGAGKPGEIDFQSIERADAKALRDREKAERDRQRDQRDRESAAQLSASLDKSLLDAKQANVGDYAELARLAQEEVKAESRALDAAIDKQAASNPYIKAQAEVLHEKVAQAEAEKLATLAAQERTRQLNAQLGDVLAADANQRDLLQSQAAIADTAGERKRLALALLKLDQDEERIRLQTLVDIGKIAGATADQRQAAEDAANRLKALPAIQDNQTKGVERQNRTPLEGFIADTSPGHIQDRVQQLEYDELMSVRRGINSAITNALGVDDPLISGLLEILLDQILFRPIAEILQAHSGGGGGGLGGLFGQLFGAVAGGLGGGAGALGGSLGAAGVTAGSMGGSLASLAAFAGGTERVPTGRDFYVGDNGREKMRLHPGGRLEVISGPRTHREAANDGGGFTLIQNNIIPERADPRRTQSGIARANQRSLATAARKGLAIPGGRP